MFQIWTIISSSRSAGLSSFPRLRVVYSTPLILKDSRILALTSASRHAWLVFLSLYSPCYFLTNLGHHLLQKICFLIPILSFYSPFYWSDPIHFKEDIANNRCQSNGSWTYSTTNRSQLVRSSILHFYVLHANGKEEGREGPICMVLWLVSSMFRKLHLSSHMNICYISSSKLTSVLIEILKFQMQWIRL